MSEAIVIKIQNTSRSCNEVITLPFPVYDSVYDDINFDDIYNSHYKYLFRINKVVANSTSSNAQNYDDVADDRICFMWKCKLVSDKLTIRYSGRILTSDSNTINALNAYIANKNTSCVKVSIKRESCSAEDVLSAYESFVITESSSQKNEVNNTYQGKSDVVCDMSEAIVIKIQDVSRLCNETIALPFPPYSVYDSVYDNISLNDIYNNCYKYFFNINRSIGSSSATSNSTQAAYDDVADDKTCFMWKCKLVSNKLTIRYSGRILTSNNNTINALNSYIVGSNDFGVELSMKRESCAEDVLSAYESFSIVENENKKASNNTASQNNNDQQVIVISSNSSNIAKQKKQEVISPPLPYISTMSRLKHILCSCVYGGGEKGNSHKR
ncbi:hypothetical protein [Candidatus Neoehrlichia procyonis]|uniref:Uncharacterized protein n=1 Tax=Candidatus Neoehrlichia procyonis str. RAC413 TaxID=1359163 RepID=A0A0F3NMG7_9RICK|nr:hypothetical protein [Candidatus Neoehrlichia lotoris]KJV68902.1 hypothetical protein NLO413_0273 [Candidatus Neoehrlichia lotoris str. RAC413]